MCTVGENLIQSKPRSISQSHLQRPGSLLCEGRSFILQEFGLQDPGVQICGGRKRQEAGLRIGRSGQEPRWMVPPPCSSSLPLPLPPSLSSHPSSLFSLSSLFPSFSLCSPCRGSSVAHGWNLAEMVCGSPSLSPSWQSLSSRSVYFAICLSWHL